MKVICIAILVASFFSVPVRVSADSSDLSSIEKTAQRFSVGVVRLGLSVEQFTSKFPTAKKWPVRKNVYPKNDVYELTVDNGTKSPPNALFEFEDGNLKFITIEYSREALQMIAKKEPVLRQLQARFGDSRLIAKEAQSDFGSVDIYGWDFRHVGVEFTYQAFHDGTARFKAFSTLNPPSARPKTSLLGFD